jgi:hypothetical protein
MKYLPLARANVGNDAAGGDCALSQQPTVERALCRLATGTARSRELIVERPQIFLQAKCEQASSSPSSSERLLNDLGALGGIARRARRALESGLLQQLLETERGEVEQAFARMRWEVQRLLQRFDLESGLAR